MKNSASNSLEIQAATSDLQKQAKQLLPELTAVFRQLDYSEIVHQRISQQDDKAIHQRVVYQGLTCTQHVQFGKVMIKWQLVANSSNLNKDSSQSLLDLNHEIAILKALNTPKHIQKNTLLIAPPVLTYHNSSVTLLAQDYQLTSLVMPYYPLASLAQQLNNKNSQLLADNQKQSFIMQAAHLIANLHRQGWLHNDIKPSNMLLNHSALKDSFLLNNANSDVETHSLLLTDFALAERIDNSVNRDSSTAAAGTPAYLAPERWQGQSATQQSDIYAFGITVYEILTGVRPFNVSKTSSELLKDWAVEHCQTSIPRLPDKYGHYQLIVDKSLAKRTQKRYKSMEEVLVGLHLLGTS